MGCPKGKQPAEIRKRLVEPGLWLGWFGAVRRFLPTTIEQPGRRPGSTYATPAAWSSRRRWVQKVSAV
jgi:hypothetical protein